MGIPVIDVFATYSFAQAHPYWTAFEIAALVALVGFVFWFTRKFQKHMGKLRLGMFVVYLAIALPLLWATFKTEPSELSLLMQGSHQAQYQQAMDKAFNKTASE